MQAAIEIEKRTDFPRHWKFVLPEHSQGTLNVLPMVGGKKSTVTGGLSRMRKAMRRDCAPARSRQRLSMITWKGSMQAAIEIEKRTDFPRHWKFVLPEHSQGTLNGLPMVGVRKETFTLKKIVCRLCLHVADTRIEDICAAWRSSRSRGCCGTRANNFSIQFFNIIFSYPRHWPNNQSRVLFMSDFSSSGIERVLKHVTLYRHWGHKAPNVEKRWVAKDDLSCRYQIEISHGLSSLSPPMLNLLARFPALWHAWQLKTSDFARNPVMKRSMRAVIQTLLYHPQCTLCGGHKPLQIRNSCYAWIW